MSACASYMYMLSQTQGKSCNNKKKCSPSFHQVGPFLIPKKLLQPATDEKQVPGKYFLPEMMLILLHLHSLINYLSISISSDFLALHSSIAHWTQRQVEWCILFCNPGFFMFRGHLILYFQLLCLHLLFFLPNLQHCLHCPTTSCEWKTEHSRGKKSR